MGKLNYKEILQYEDDQYLGTNFMKIKNKKVSTEKLKDKKRDKNFKKYRSENEF